MYYCCEIFIIVELLDKVAFQPSQSTIIHLVNLVDKVLPLLCIRPSKSGTFFKGGQHHIILL
jgi:hypothetical protein